MSAEVFTHPLPTWRLKGMGFLRIVFGLVWAVDAWFKWQPDFVNNLTTYLTGNTDDHSAWVHGWISFWIDIINVNPTLFAYLVALGETAVGLGLLLGLLSNLTYGVGIFLSLIIWTTAESFGGPYRAGATDIGAAIIYVLVFVGLFLASAGLYYGLDYRLTLLLGRWNWIASGGSKVRTRDTNGSVSDQFGDNGQVRG